jgi:hypothetical protein
MRKILNGLRYDTENGIEIGTASSNLPVNDFGHWEATLYHTPRSGRFFLAGHGGAMSRFAQSAGQNCWQGGSDLIPMTREEALEWAEVNLTVTAIEAAFGGELEDA